MTASPAGTSGNFALGGYDPARQSNYVMAELKKSGLQVEKARFERGRKVHRVIANWDEAKKGLSSSTVVKKLLDGEHASRRYQGRTGRELNLPFS